LVFIKEPSCKCDFAKRVKATKKRGEKKKIKVAAGRIVVSTVPGRVQGRVCQIVCIHKSGKRS